MRTLRPYVVVALLALSSLASADQIKNWSAPSTWTPPSAQARGRSALTTYPPVPFMPLAPCRLIDTRALSGFPAGYGPPAIAGGGTQRTFTITGQCGIPAGAQAVSFNFAVFLPTTIGDLRVFPAGGATPLVSTLNWDAGIFALANAAVVPLGAGGAITVRIDGAGTVDIFVDVNGFYGDTTTTAGTFTIINASGATGILGESTGGGVGVYGLSLGSGGWGVYGANDSASGYGVYGYNGGSGVGVYGLSSTYVGVKGKSTDYNGVWAESTNWDGLYAVGGRDGAFIQGARNGVVGSTTGTTGAVAGVVGSDGTGSPSASALDSNSGGLFFSQTGFGVWGASRYTGAFGQLYNSSGASLGGGLLGTTFGTAAIDSTPGPWGVFSWGNFGASGTKHFVEPHPTDAKKVILYSSLEGREVGTYFRGTASIVNHEAVIVIPEDFRIVTDEEGLTIQVTPIGAYSQVYVESQDLNQIVIRGSRDVKFHYMVNGVRRAFKNFEPVQTGYEFMPRSPSGRMPLYLTEEAKARLISNGTYNPDGTVNMTTAERTGFTKIWADREAEAKAAAAKNAKADQRP